ncbi:hypothetical protein BT69DRAFT_1352850, partial [Atractiella rhizophila]
MDNHFQYSGVDTTLDPLYIQPSRLLFTDPHRYHHIMNYLRFAQFLCALVGQSPDVSGTTAISQSNYQCLDLPASSNLSLHATTNERTAVEESSQQNKDPVPEIGHFQLNQTSMVSDSPSLPPLLHPTIHQNAFMVKIRAHQRVPGYIQLGQGEDLFLRVEGSRLVPLSASKYSPWDVNHILLSQHRYPSNFSINSDSDFVVLPVAARIDLIYYPSSSFQSVSVRAGYDLDCLAIQMNDSIAGPSAPTSSLLTQALTYALEAKERGNSAIREKQYTAALDAYEEALGDLPEDFGNEKVELQDIQKKLKDVRMILHANRAQGLLKLERYAEAVEACTLSLRDDDTFVKAIHRRAIANSSIGTWSSLVSAQEDYTRLLSLPLSSGRPS